MRLKDFLEKDETVEKRASFHKTASHFFGGLQGPGVVSKIATDYRDDVPVHEGERDSRKRRLAELLKKREHSGTATGSASPNPPRGS